jgi:tetratricopeptide (TPR) repeat protein
MTIQKHPETGPEAGEVARGTVQAHVAANPPAGLALPGERWWFRMALALIFALYVRAITFAPVYDDNYLSDGTGGWSDVPRFFTTDIFGTAGTAHSVYYRPLSMTWGFLVGTVTGGAPGWMHLSAIFLHLAVVMLAYVFGRLLFGDERMALLSALLFGLHPSKVESVAWIGSANVDGLGGVFFFASLIAFLNWHKRPQEKSHEGGMAGWMALSVAMFTCAMFTKETMVQILILMGAYLLLNGPAENTLAVGTARQTRMRALTDRMVRTARTLLPYGAVWVVYMAIRHQVIKPAAPSAEYIQPTFTHNNLWTAPYSIWWYLGHLTMPWGLSVEYTSHVIDQPTWLTFGLPALGLLFFLAAAGWLCWLQRSAVAAFLLFWFALTLAPAVIVAPMVLQHDRYLYLASYAFCALVAWAILRLGSFPAKARLAVALGVVALWSGLTWHETGYWDDDMALWGRVLQISPSSTKAQIQLAFLCANYGDSRKALSLLDDGLRYHPNSLNIWLARASILADNLQTDEARAAYLKVVQLTEAAPGQAVPPGQPTRIRATASYRLALIDIKAKNFAEAEHYIRMALSLRPDGVGYHAVLSESLRGEGRMDEANVENSLELRLRLAQQRQAGPARNP